MEQKNFKLMSTKTLRALLKTASDEDKVLIQEILYARNVMKIQITYLATGNKVEPMKFTDLTLDDLEAMIKYGNKIKIEKI